MAKIYNEEVGAIMRGDAWRVNTIHLGTTKKGGAFRPRPSTSFPATFRKRYRMDKGVSILPAKLECNER